MQKSIGVTEERSSSCPSGAEAGPEPLHARHLGGSLLPQLCHLPPRHPTPPMDRLHPGGGAAARRQGAVRWWRCAVSPVPAGERGRGKLGKGCQAEKWRRPMAGRGHAAHGGTGHLWC
ncbi:hypothetical protein NHX12_002450 [Muraenolepis orangiensis]|uniref:Uncharacterized protein n=1 Tax=Muraenolepis orangiensis TaxID=630683 RepID=A0A9Q0DYH4_9TELE|nr:hypothetical protein NHX12_002450 [Muraenolepis orangiensis]